MESDARWALAMLASPPSMMLCGNGNLTESHLEWVQDIRLWSVIYYHHANALTYGTRTYAVQVGDIAILSPGVVYAHARIGDDTYFDYMSFDLPSKTGPRAALPHVARSMESILPQFRKASSRIVDTSAPACAFIWNLLWVVAQSSSLFRESEVLYIAEDFIRRNLDKRIAVADVAETAGVSPRSLLSVFRSHHGVSIQEYVMRKRVQEASRLLLGTNLAIKEIAARVGMADLQYFNKTMRAMTGKAPSRFRQRE